VYVGGQWETMRDPSDYSARAHPLSNDPISEQVAGITLPDGEPLRRG
jgi:arginine-tRNA-protein transferase